MSKEKIGLIGIIIIMLLSSIFVMPSETMPTWITLLITSAFTTVYVIYKKIKKEKNVIIKSKLDIAILIFMLSPLIPLIFNTTVSFSETIIAILRYWTIYGVYILARNLITEDKEKKIIINALIIISVIPIILGYDMFFKINLFQPILSFFNISAFHEYRMISVFDYANTYAIYLSVMTFLAIAMFLNTEEKKLKILYGIYILIASITIILTQSKATIALLGILILIFILKKLKDKEIPKKYIIIGVSLIIAFFIYFCVGLNFSKPVVVKGNQEEWIRGIEPNTKYVIEFDVNAETNTQEECFEIQIDEANQYNITEIKGKVTFGTCNDTKKIEFTTGDSVDHLALYMKNMSEQEFTINACRINGEKYTIKYLMLPNGLVRMFTTFNFKNSSVWQRFDYWGDGFKIIKDNWLFGAGGNAWNLLYGKVQDYQYYSANVHSNILDIWMSFGIISLIAFISILVLILKNVKDIIKNRSDIKVYRMQVAMLISILIIFLHSCMDMDFSFITIGILFYLLVALSSSKDKELKTKKIEIIDYIIVIAFAVITTINILGLTSDLLKESNPKLSSKLSPWNEQYMYNDIVGTQNPNEYDKENMQKMINYMKKEPYSQQQQWITTYLASNISRGLEQEGYEANVEGIDFWIDFWRNNKIESKYDSNMIIQKINNELEILMAMNNLENITEETKKQMLEIIEIVEKDYKEYENNILEYTKHKDTKEESEKNHQKYTELYNKILKIKEKI